MKAYFIQQQEDLTWAKQFRMAVELKPSLDEDNMIMDDVTMGEAINHFLTMPWKVLFAIIPPSKMGGGWPEFIVALTLIGSITYVETSL